MSPFGEWYSLSLWGDFSTGPKVKSHSREAMSANEQLQSRLRTNSVNRR
jgi:hypothetical protein